MARPRRSVTKNPVKEEEGEESAWEQSEEETDEEEEEFQADDEEADDEDDDDEDEDLSEEEAPVAKKPAAKISKAPATSKLKKPPAPRKRKRRKHYDTDTSDDGHLMPTVLRKTNKGGYSHTHLSRARISKANRGNTPWNKGRQRSEADKAKIAAAVRARNAAILKEKLKKFNMTEEEFRAKQKEIKYLRERVRRAKVTAKKKREQLDAGGIKLEVDLHEAIAARDEVINTKTGVIKKEALAAALAVEEAKMRDEAEKKREKEGGEAPSPKPQSSEGTTAASSDQEQAPDTIASTPKKRSSKKQKKSAEKANTTAKSPPPSRFPIVVWNMEWTPHLFDTEPPSCPNGGPAGLVCCETCAAAYSQHMARSVQDMEGRRMEAVSNQVEELLGYIEETRMQLLVTAQAARQKPPPQPIVPIVAKRLGGKHKVNENAQNLDTAVMDWAMTSTLDMSNFDATSVRI